jgi:hypothetical protein
MNCSTNIARLASSALFIGTLQAQAPQPAAPTEPVGAILGALRSYRVVGLGTGAHNNEQGHAFLLTLIQHADFPSAGADLVIEWGNALYQDSIDRFVDGEDVPREVLRRAWEDTTQPHAGCDTPIHEELYRAVRTINAALSQERRVRVFLGDPPIDWNSPTEKQDREKFMFLRDSYPAQVIQREILAKGRRALVVYGQGHLQRQQMLSNYEMSHELAHTIVSLIEKSGVRVFTVWGNTRVELDTVQRDIVSWPRPSLALLRGTTLGAEDFRFFFSDISNRFAVRDGKLAPIPRDQWRAMRMEDQFDALLYLGPPSSITTSQLPSTLCADAPYMKMRLARLDVYGPKGEADRVRTYCADAQKTIPAP